MNRGQEQDLRNTGTMYRLPVVLLVAKLALSHRQTPVAMQSVLFSQLRMLMECVRPTSHGLKHLATNSL